LVHLRMSGRLVVEPGGTPRDAYERVGLRFDDGHELRFLDVRKFGRFVFHEDPAPTLARLGPEPLGPTFTVSWLRAALKGRRRMLKPLLLDQTFLAGLGNIYVDESLFRARIHPRRSADSLDRRAAAALHAAIREILAEAVAREGSSIDAFYRTPEGRPGAYQERFRVYGRAGRPCLRCGGPVRRLVVGQRGTHVCLRCQRPPRRRR
jgi:formamidopyrimidine-DNA glycosylase